MANYNKKMNDKLDQMIDYQENHNKIDIKDALK
jgi:hypothetical protein